MSDLPAPGIYPDMPFAEYLALDCASRSTLSKLADWRQYTPQDVRYEMLHPTPGSEAMALGTALHAQLLEPGSDTVAVAPQVDRRTKDGKATWAAFLESSAGKTVITADQGQQLEAMRSAVLAHPKAAAILARAEAKEVTIIANLSLRALHDRLGLSMLEWPAAEDDHLLVKARLDILCPSAGLVADLKTTKAKTEWELQKAFNVFGYSHQAALYPEMARAAGYDVEHFAALFVRNCEPYRAGVFRADDLSIAAAWRELLPAMVQMAECYRTEEWPGWEDEIMDISLPDWKMREMER